MILSLLCFVVKDLLSTEPNQDKKRLKWENEINNIMIINPDCISFWENEFEETYRDHLLKKNK